MTLGPRARQHHGIENSATMNIEGKRPGNFRVGRGKESPLRDLARQLRAVAENHIAFSQVVELMGVVDSHINAMALIEEYHAEQSG